MEALLTRREVADLFRISPRTIDRWRAAGELPCVELGGTVRFRPAALDAHLAGVEKNGGAETPVPRQLAPVRHGRRKVEKFVPPVVAANRASKAERRVELDANLRERRLVPKVLQEAKSQ